MLQLRQRPHSSWLSCYTTTTKTVTGKATDGHPGELRVNNTTNTTDNENEILETTRNHNKYTICKYLPTQQQTKTKHDLTTFSTDPLVNPTTHFSHHTFPFVTAQLKKCFNNIFLFTVHIETTKLHAPLILRSIKLNKSPSSTRGPD